MNRTQNFVGDIAEVEEHKGKQCYLNNDMIMRKGIKLPITMEQRVELARVSTDIEYFTRNYVYINTLDHGIQPFNLYDYQMEFIDGCYNNRFVMGMWGRQMGKCVKGDTFVSFELNGVSGTATIKDMMEMALESGNKEQNWKSNSNGYALSKDHPAMKKFTKTISGHGLKIHTPTGMQDVKYIFETIPYEVYELKTFGDKFLEAADNHIVILKDGSECFVKDLEVGQIIRTIDGEDIVESVRKTGETVNMYDIEIKDEDHVFYTNGILSHNTTTVMAYLLQQAITRENMVIAILANKADAAQEVLSRIKDSYELLPWYMQVGVEEWNKTRITLGNGSVIMTAGTSSSSIRGKSINCVTSYSRALYKVDGFLEPQNLTIYDLIKRGYVQESRMPGKSKDNKYKKFYKNVGGLKVYGPNGFNDFDGVLASPCDGNLVQIRTKRYTLVCTPDHKVILENGDEIFAQDLEIGQRISTINGSEPVVSIKHVVEKEVDKVYDLFNIQNGNIWYSDNVLSHNCVLGDTKITVKTDDGEIIETDMETLYANAKGYGVEVYENVTNGGQDFHNNTYLEIAQHIEKFDTKSKYFRKYMSLVVRAMNRDVEDDIYTENHHVLPKSMGGSDKPGNIARLTLREHMVAHKMLPRIVKFEYKSSMGVALFMMSNTRNLSMSSAEYEAAKTLARGRALNYRHTDKSKTIMSDKQKQHWNDNKEEIISKRLANGHYKRSGESVSKYANDNPEHRSEWQNRINTNPEKISKTAEKHRGMKRSDESRAKMSAAAKLRGCNNKGKIMINDGEIVAYIDKNAPIPDGWTRGRNK